MKLEERSISQHLRLWRHGMETFLDQTLLNQILKYISEDFKKENSWLLNCDLYSLVHLFILNVSFLSKLPIIYHAIDNGHKTETV